MTEFGDIYLAWRKGTGLKRHLVGVIKRNKQEGIRFEYLEGEVMNEAKKDGFNSYTEFPDLAKTYDVGVLNIFKQRLFKSEREDYQQFLDFWRIDSKYKDDTLYLLAHTQGLVPTDNFEFLARFNLTKNLMFVSEIAGLSYTQVDSKCLEERDELVWKKNPTEFDSYQVDLYKNGNKLGHVKKVHSEIFYKKRAENLSVRIKSLNKNGVVKRAFIEISVR